MSLIERSSLQKALKYPALRNRFDLSHSLFDLFRLTQANLSRPEKNLPNALAVSIHQALRALSLEIKTSLSEEQKSSLYKTCGLIINLALLNSEAVFRSTSPEKLAKQIFSAGKKVLAAGLDLEKDLEQIAQVTEREISRELRLQEARLEFEGFINTLDYQPFEIALGLEGYILVRVEAKPVSRQKAEEFMLMHFDRELDARISARLLRDLIDIPDLPVALREIDLLGLNQQLSGNDYLLKSHPERLELLKAALVPPVKEEAAPVVKSAICNVNLGSSSIPIEVLETAADLVSEINYWLKAIVEFIKRNPHKFQLLKIKLNGETITSMRVFKEKLRQQLKFIASWDIARRSEMLAILRDCLTVNINEADLSEIVAEPANVHPEASVDMPAEAPKVETGATEVFCPPAQPANGRSGFLLKSVLGKIDESLQDEFSQAYLDVPEMPGRHCLLEQLNKLEVISNELARKTILRMKLAAVLIKEQNADPIIRMENAGRLIRQSGAVVVLRVSERGPYRFEAGSTAQSRKKRETQINRINGLLNLPNLEVHIAASEVDAEVIDCFRGYKGVVRVFVHDAENVFAERERLLALPEAVPLVVPVEPAPLPAELVDAAPPEAAPRPKIAEADIFKESDPIESERLSPNERRLLLELKDLSPGLKREFLTREQILGFGVIPAEKREFLKTFRDNNLLLLLLQSIYQLRETKGLDLLWDELYKAFIDDNLCRSIGFANEIIIIATLLNGRDPETDPLIIAPDLGNIYFTIRDEKTGAIIGDFQSITPDAYRKKSRTLIEIKYAKYGNLNGFREQACKYGEALKNKAFADIVKSVEYHITTVGGQIAEEQLAFLAQTVPNIKVYVYDKVGQAEGRLLSLERFGGWVEKANELCFLRPGETEFSLYKTDLESAFPGLSLAGLQDEDVRLAVIDAIAGLETKWEECTHKLFLGLVQGKLEAISKAGEALCEETPAADKVKEIIEIAGFIKTCGFLYQDYTKLDPMAAEKYNTAIALAKSESDLNCIRKKIAKELQKMQKPQKQKASSDKAPDPRIWKEFGGVSVTNHQGWDALMDITPEQAAAFRETLIKRYDSLISSLRASKDNELIETAQSLKKQIDELVIPKGRKSATLVKNMQRLAQLLLEIESSLGGAK